MYQQAKAYLLKIYRISVVHQQAKEWLSKTKHQSSKIKTKIVDLQIVLAAKQKIIVAHQEAKDFQKQKTCNQKQNCRFEDSGTEDSIIHMDIVEKEHDALCFSSEKCSPAFSRTDKYS